MKNKGNQRWLHWMPAITFGVLLYAAVMNIGKLAKIGNQILTMFSPLLVGIGIALVMNVPLRGAEALLRKLDKHKRLDDKWRMRLSFIMVLVFTPLVIAAILIFFIPQLTSAINNLYNIVIMNSADIEAFINRFMEEQHHFDFQHILDGIKNWFTGNISKIAGVTMNTAVSLFSSVTSGVMSIIFAIYVLLDKKRICHSAARCTYAILPKNAAAYICKVCRLFASTFSTFLSRQCLESVILGGILFIGMTIFGIPYALSICSLTIVLALIPYVGAFMSLGIGALMILLESPTEALIFVLLFTVIQQIEGNVIYPRVVGESVGLPAYITLMAVTLGGAFMGIVGMLLFVPISSVIYTLAKEYIDQRMPEPFEECKILIQSVPPDEEPVQTSPEPEAPHNAEAPVYTATNPKKKSRKRK